MRTLFFRIYKRKISGTAAAAVAAVLIAVLLCGCGSRKPQTASVTVDSNPTTGYTWQVTQTEELFDVTSEYQQDEETEGLTGAGGKETITLTPKTRGKTEVTLAYAREWEDAEPETSIIYELEVTGSMQIKELSVTGSMPGDADTVPELPALEIK